MLRCGIQVRILHLAKSGPPRRLPGLSTRARFIIGNVRIRDNAARLLGLVHHDEFVNDRELTWPLDIVQKLTEIKAIVIR